MAFEEVVIPVITASAPQVLIISAGYDAHFGDPLGGMLVSAAGFWTLAERVFHSRPERTGVAALLEGGYDLAHVSDSVIATLAAFGGQPAPVAERPRTGAETPYATVRARIRQVRSVARNYWNI